MKSSEVEIGTIVNDESLSDGELLERMHAIEERRQQLEKQREREELRKDPDLRKKQYRYAIWHCHPRCGFKCDRRDEASIISHRSTCGWKIEERQEREKQKQAKYEGIQKMRYVLGMLSKCEDDIKTQQRKIERETKEKRQNWNVVCAMSRARIDEIKNTIKREQEERQKLLNHENEIIRSAARELYERYMAASESDRRRDLY